MGSLGWSMRRYRVGRPWGRPRCRCSYHVGNCVYVRYRVYRIYDDVNVASWLFRVIHFDLEVSGQRLKVNGI